MSESLSPWMTIAGGGDSRFFDLERLILAPEGRPGHGSGHVEHLGNFFQSKSSAARVRHDSSLMKKIAIGFLHTPVGDLRTRNFIAWPRKSGTTKQFKRRRAAKTRALVAKQGDTFSGWGARFGDGWHDNYPGAKRRWVQADRPLWFLAFEVKPAWQGLSCGQNYFLQKICHVYAGRSSSSHW
jgi:hypothetical protein